MYMCLMYAYIYTYAIWYYFCYALLYYSPGSKEQLQQHTLLPYIVVLLWFGTPRCSVWNCNGSYGTILYGLICFTLVMLCMMYPFLYITHYVVCTILYLFCGYFWCDLLLLCLLSIMYVVFSLLSYTYYLRVCARVYTCTRKSTWANRQYRV